MSYFLSLPLPAQLLEPPSLRDLLLQQEDRPQRQETSQTATAAATAESRESGTRLVRVDAAGGVLRAPATAGAKQGGVAEEPRGLLAVSGD